VARQIILYRARDPVRQPQPGRARANLWDARPKYSPRARGQAHSAMTEPQSLFSKFCRRAAGSMWLWLIVSLVLLCAVTPVNPAKLGVYGWLVCKLTMAAALGYCFDLSGFPDARPAQLEGIEKAMAQTRRGTIIAATLIATGLMP
jgi:hypothetical protein